MNQILIFMKILVFVCWIVGIFTPLNATVIFWAIPAGYAGGTLLTELTFKLKEWMT